MRAANCHRLWLLLLGMVCSAWAIAQTPSFDLSVYVDNDSRPGTGCTVTLSDGSVLPGIEHQLVATAQGLPPMVTAVRRLSCNGATLVPAATLGGGYPVGLNNGVSGSDVVEFAVPRYSVVPPANGGIRLYFVGESVPRGGIDVLLTRDGSQTGGPIFFGFAISIPSMTHWGLMLLALGLAVGGFVVLRRHPNARALVVLLVLGSVTLTALAVAIKSADGNVNDWTGISALANDPAGDGSTPEAGNDLRAGFLQIEGNELLVRIDVLDLENQPPVAAPQAVSTLEDTFVDITLSATDPEGSAMTFNVISGPTAGTLGTITQLTPTTASVRYTPNVDRNGSDSFTFSATDDGGATSAPATVSLTITPVNDVPRFTAQDPPAVNEDAAAQTATVATGIAAGPATATDETAQTLTFNIAGNSNAALFSAGPAISAAGVLTYTPAAEASGTAVLTVSLSDNGGTANGGVATSATQTITITVNPVNDAPVNTVPGAQTIAEDTALVFSSANGNLISTSDVDAGANPVLLTLGTPNGTLTLSGLVGLTGTGNGTGMLSYTGSIAAINTALAGLSFTPAANFNGAAAIAITVNDQGNTGGPAQSDTDNIAITITPINDIPTFTGGPAQTVLEDAGAQTVAAWATAINDGDTEVQILTFQFTANDNAALFSTAPSVDPATGNLTYTPAANANGVANLTLVLRDDGGTAGGGIDTSTPYNFTITVTAVNDAPSYTASTPATVLEDAGAQTLTGWATFNPGPANESAQTVLAYNVTAVGTPALFSAPPAVAANGTLTYTPAANANGTSTFTVSVQDSGGTANTGVDTSPPQTFTITVTAVNDAPSYTAGPAQTVLEDAGAQTVPGWATAISAGPANESGQVLTFNVTNNSNPTLFSAAPVVAANGTLSYTPAANASGIATISLQLMDDGGTANAGVNVSGVQTFTITVTAVDDAPVAVNDATTVGEDSGATAVAVLTNDTDVDAGPISIAGITPPLNGTVVITGGGSGLTYAPNANYCNTAPVAAADTFGYSLTPGGSSAMVSVTVTCANDAPVNTLPVTQNIGAGGTLTFNVVNGNLISIADVDVGSSLLSINLSTGALANGTVSLTDLAGLATVTGNGTQTVTATGTLTAINASLEGLTYTAPAVPPGTGNASLTLISNDQGATGTGGAQSDTDSLTINIDNPPSVTTVVPTAGASNQGTGTGVTVTFSEPVAALASALNVTCAPSGGSANSVANANTTTLSVTGAAIGAQAGDTCTVTVTAASVTDIDTIDPPNAMLANFTSSYSIDTPPTVSSTTPANGASNVAANTTITVNFSEAVNVTAGGFALSCSSGPALTLAPAALTNASTVTLTPSAALPPSATCTLTVNAANVTDSDAGDPPDNMAVNFSASFTTVDPAPSVTTTTPANGGTGSAVADITVNFSEAVTFSGASFTLECPVGSPVTFVASGSGTTTATINPTGNLPVGTVCTVTVLATGIADVDAIDPPDNMAANVVFTFTAVNAPPVLTAGATTNYTEDGLAVVIDPTITVADSDNTSLTSATVEITTNFATGQDVLSFVNTANITGIYNATTGVLTLAGTDTLLNYQAALRSVRYSNTSDTPSILLRTIRWIGSDGVAPSAPVTSTVNVTATDDAPTAVADAATVVEDSGANAINVLANDTDPDAGTISIVSVTQPANGVVVITGGGTGLSYAPNANYCNAPPGTTLSTFTYTLTPGGSSTTVTVTVTCVDDNPVAVADSATVAEDSGANAINVLANDTDVDGGPISVSAVTQPANGTVVITGGGTGLTYAPNANYCNTPPGTTLSTFTYTLTPGGSSTTVSVAVTCVDDPPVAVADAATVLEDSGANAINVLANDTDPDGGPISVSAVTQPANGSVVITGGGTGLTYAPNANYCNAPPGTTLSTFTYTLTPGGSSTTVTVTVTCVNDPPVAANDAFDFIGNTELRVDLAAVGTPHALEATVAGVGVLGNDSDPVESNTFTVSSLTVGACTDAVAPFTCTDAAVGTVNMTASGTFSFVPAPGDTGATETFTYQITDNGTPAPASATGTVTMTRFDRVWYIDPNGAAGGNGSSSTPLIAFTALNGAGGAGDSDAAGDYIFVHDGTISGALELEANQRLLGEGAGISVPVNLNGNGSPTVLVAAGTRPQWNHTGNVISISNAIPVEIRGLSLASTGGNAIDLTSAAALAGSTALEIASNVVTGASAEGFDFNINAGTTGTLNLSIHDNNLTATGNALDIVRNAGTVNITAFNDNVVTGASAASGIVVSGVGAPITFDATPGAPYNSVSGGTTTIGVSGDGVGTSGLLLNNVAGDLTFADLDVFSSNGTAVLVSGTGAVNVGAGTGTRVSVGSNVGTVNATNGAALDLTGITADMQGLTLSSVNSTGNGVSLVTVTDGTTAANVSTTAGSSISNAAGTDFLISGGNATVTYPGTITDDLGVLVNVNGTTGDTKTFSGAITDGNDGDGSGITLTGNTGASILFSGGLLLSTGPNAAFTASGGGTISVCDENPCNAAATGALVNTLTTTAGTALNVANTTISSNHLEFRSISAGTAAGSAGIGISLNNTGTGAGTGGLRIKGTGTAASGGTIQRKTGADGVLTDGIGIVLQDTANVSLSFLQMNDFDNSAITGRSVNGFTLNNSVINGTIGNNSGATEGAINFGVSNPGGVNGLLGTGVIHNTRISGSVEHNLEFYNQSGSMNLTIDGTTAISEGANPNIASDDTADCSIDANSAAFGADGLLVEMQGTATATVLVDRCIFRDNKSQAIQVAANDSSVVDMTVDESFVRRFSQGNEGIILSNGSNGRLTAHVTSNSVNNIGGTSIFVGQTPGNANALAGGIVGLTAVVRGNTISTPATATNHALIAYLTSTVGQTSLANILIDSNTIAQNSTTGVARPFLVDTPDTNTTPSWTATVINNNVTFVDAATGSAASVTARRGTGCFDVRNNVVAGPFGIAVRQTAPGTVQLEQGISGSAVPATVLDDNHAAGTVTGVIGVPTVVGNNTCLLPPT